MPGFHAMLPVRDEEDIVAESIPAMLEWADNIFVFDTGSIDRTWEIVNELATQDRRIRILRRDPVYFNDCRVRGWLFDVARKHMKEGDWFLRVDADEFHHITPPDFVRTRMAAHETLAFHQYYNFALLRSQVDALESQPEGSFRQDIPISKRCRWYTPSTYSEPRLCRYRSSMRWPHGTSFPYNAGFAARERLPIRHYPHRDPMQMQRRCRLRSIMMEDRQNRLHWTDADSHHWVQGEWRKFVKEDGDPNLIFWKEGSLLQEVKLLNHLPTSNVRIIQRLLHTVPLALLDYFRPPWDESGYPESISAPVLDRLNLELIADTPTSNLAGKSPECSDKTSPLAPR